MAARKREGHDATARVIVSNVATMSFLACLEQQLDGAFARHFKSSPPFEMSYVFRIAELGGAASKEEPRGGVIMMGPASD